MNPAGRIRAAASTALAFVMVAGFAVAQSYPSRGRMSAAPGSNWSSAAGVTSTSDDVTIAGVLGDSRVLQVGSATANHGGLIKIYANPGVINAMEFRNPGDSTLRGYFYPSTSVAGLAQGPTLFESAANNGTATLVAGSATKTVLTGAKCVCTDTTANASVKCAVSGTTLTVTGTGTDVIAYHCF